jgi:uncharacterized protein (TIGR03083 family)
MSGNDEISCENCVAACCTAPVQMVLSRDEYREHRHVMDLEVKLKPRDYPQVWKGRKLIATVTGEQRVNEWESVVERNHGVFLLRSGCAYLDEHHRCTIYERRPQVCRNFEVGSAQCLNLRLRAGLDSDRPIPDYFADEDEPRSMLEEFFPAWSEHGSSPTTPADPGPAVDPLDLEAVRRVVARESEIARQLVGDADDRLWRRRTRLPGWSVRDLAGHVVTGLRYSAEAVEAALEGRAAIEPPDFHGTRGSTLEELDAAILRVALGLERTGPAMLEREVVIGDDAVGLRYFLQVVASEISVHTHDLADACGASHRLLEDSLRAVVATLPMLLENGARPPAGAAFLLRSELFELPFAWRDGIWHVEHAPDPCLIDGAAEPLALFALGRRSFDDVGLITNRPDAARRFKRYLPGP